MPESKSPNSLLPVSVVIFSSSEEINTAGCLRSCLWSDDIHVVDSGNTDRTADIAARMGAKFHVSPGGSFARQRNWALDQVACRHSWQLHLRAHERVTPELAREIGRLGFDTPATQYAAFRVPSRVLFRDKWLEHSGLYAPNLVRLFKTGGCRFIESRGDEGHDCKGNIGTLHAPYLDLSFEKGLRSWLVRHNKQCNPMGTAAPAMGPAKNDQPRGAGPFRRFFTSYFLRQGWMDGPGGFHYCVLLGMSEYWMRIKALEAHSDWPGATTRLARQLRGKQP